MLEMESTISCVVGGVVGRGAGAALAAFFEAAFFACSLALIPAISRFLAALGPVVRLVS
jgi:hypothetical protein